MRLNRFIGNFKLKPGGFRLENTEILNQIRSVLKLRIGEKIILCDGLGNEALAEIREYGKEYILLEITGLEANKNEPEGDFVLYCAVLKKENFELVVQKATEIGIKEIVPILTERTIKLNIRLDRLEKIIKEAAEQSGRGMVPVLNEPLDFEKAVKAAGSNHGNLFFDISGESLIRPERLLNNTGRVGIWIGPEGGWTEKELDVARGSNFKIINLGKLTLRAETAAIAASYMVVHPTLK